MPSEEPLEDLEGDVTLDDRRYDRRTVLAGALAGGVMLASPSLAAAARRSDARTIRRGGVLRVGMVGNGPNEMLDPQNQQNVIDTARDRILFDTLARQRADGSVEPRLAVEFEPNKQANIWTVHLRPDVEWHDGKPFTARDVVYSFRRIITQKRTGAATLAFLDPNRMKALDNLTARFWLKEPYALFDIAAATSVNIIIQNGASRFTTTNLIGTGPFRLTRVVPGVRSTFRRNPNYFEEGKPYVDQLIFVVIPDSTARLNALLGGQVDVIEQVNSAQVSTIRSRSNMAVLNAPSGHWVPMCMNCTQAPFNDVRVRQAIRLIADRRQMIRSALAGFGTVGNDLFGVGDPLFAKSLPQRTQDIERAKSLLRAAGRSDLSVQLQSSDAGTGMLASSLALAEQAKAAGVRIEVVNNPADSYYAQQYMKTPFFMTDWAGRSLDPQIALCATRNAPFNETQWLRPEFEKLVAQGRRELNAAKRRELFFRAQKLLYDQGGYLIWGFVNTIDGYNKKVRGLRAHPGRNLGFYNFNDVTMT